MSRLTLTLVEGRPARISRSQLSRADIAYLGELRGRIVLTPAGEDWMLVAQGWAGMVQLSQIRLEIRPKIHPEKWRQSLFTMLAEAAGEDILNFSRIAHFTTQQNPFAPFIAYFVTKSEELLRDGIYRAYRPREAQSPIIRGKLNLAQFRWPSPGLELRCRFHELTADIPENQLLLAALDRVAAASIGVELTARATALRDLLGDVSLTIPRAELQYHRLNERYRTLHVMCRILLENLSVGLGHGIVPFASFLVSMPRLYERFLTNRMTRAFGRSRTLAQPNGTIWGDPGNQIPSVRISPDIVLFARDGQAIAAIDLKYKSPTTLNRFGKERRRNSDMYQIFTYARFYNCPGLLVYPSHELGSSGVVDWFTMDNTRCAVVTVDLTRAPSDLGGELIEIVRELDRERAAAAN